MTAKNVLQRRSAKAMEGTGFVRRYLTLAGAIAFAAAGYVSPSSSVASEVAAPGADTTIEVALIDDLARDSSADAAATCPAGRRVVGGGLSSTGPETGTIDYRVELNGPLDETGLTANTDDGDVARHWYASIYNNTSTSRDFKVFALCSQDSDATVEAESINGLAYNRSVAATATCPQGTRAIGGGVGTTGPVSNGVNYEVQLSGPQDETGLTASTDDGDVARHWYASIFNNTTTPKDFKVFALCSQSSDATVEVQSFSVDFGSAAATATCPPGTRALAGGVNTTGPDGFGREYIIEQSGPQDETGLTASTDDGDVARHWHAAIYNSLGGPDFKTFAICASEPGAPGGAGGGAGPGGSPAAVCAGKPATIVGTTGPDTLSGTSNADVIAGLGGNDVLKGLGANDRICGGPGKDKIGGGAGADLLNGGTGADRISGGPGGDRINGGPGKDRCNGGPGVDKVSNC